ncbi:hypothetical protein BFAG_03091 [Bacteroides fragilis 3_1_12]|uniref:Uncharacterized protein n=1 Tax=Bacteroides fragilis 3_1_12 TaxID=457424 RepID=A0ABN0BND3_BACFG|nr:hypothetical protein BFAG_03091 [Bacteroides fragilis 3_1_12]
MLNFVFSYFINLITNNTSRAFRFIAGARDETSGQITKCPINRGIGGKRTIQKIHISLRPKM